MRGLTSDDFSDTSTTLARQGFLYSEKVVVVSLKFELVKSLNLWATKSKIPPSLVHMYSCGGGGICCMMRISNFLHRSYAHNITRTTQRTLPPSPKRQKSYQAALQALPVFSIRWYFVPIRSFYAWLRAQEEAIVEGIT